GTVCLDNVTLETTDSTVGIKNYLYKALEDLSPAFFRFPGGCIIEGSSMNTAYDWKNSIGAVKENGDDKVNAFTYTLDDGTPHEVTTYGEFATRTPNTNLWGYNNNDAKKCYYEMDYSIGFYEYFILCEALNASAIPILNCGMSCQIQGGDYGNKGVALAGRHSNGVADYIQDALDLVAFAKGDVNSSDANEKYWANVRKNMGHHAHFDITYLGIGNEQWSNAYYNTYYEKFVEAFQTASESNEKLYGGIKLIVGNGPLFGQCENTEEGTAGEAKTAAINYRKKGKIDALSEYGVVDHHYYMGYIDFFQNTHFYDNYSRDVLDGYEVFVGEYSANNNDHPAGIFQHTNNSWITALSEAAFMTGLERNGDVVKLAAYAPMYGKYQTKYTFPDNNWPADMMFYTNTELLLTPNYYVQQIFMKNAGDYKVQSELN
ncbi:MAG: hypothetical protein K2N74_01025, partial [Clostridiales bacterium]|nr:hypothetical protein [Clostridiales bacterium]